MLLTLTATSLQHYKRAKKALDVADLPDFVAEELELRGLSMNAAMLKGMSATELEKLRDRADRARCPVLVLVEDRAQDFTTEHALAQARDRVAKLGMAASKLGCPNVAIQCSNITDTNVDAVALNIKRMLSKLDRFEIHLLIRPGTGITADPGKLAELIKKIGGFRIGTLPSFAAASDSGDAEAALRRLAPYAQAVEATVKSIDKSGKHGAWDLEKCIEAIRGVGYQNTVGIDYVGKTDPVGAIKRARDVLMQVIEPGAPAA